MLKMYIADPTKPGDPLLLEWFREYGLDPVSVSTRALHWMSLDDGGFVLHYLEFVFDKVGKRILQPDFRGHYGAGSRPAVHPRLIRVDSIPASAIEVASE